MLSPSEEVKNRLDVAEVIGGYMKLNQAGANLKGLCPFHHEKTPSFYVSKEKQVWHCFGCGLGGDIFSFVMKMDGVEFPDALRILAGRAGITLMHEDPRVRSERARMYDTLKTAAAFYQEVLARDTEEDIRQYLSLRGVSPATTEDFKLGYAPSVSWDALSRHLKFKGFRPEEMERAGLLVRNERGEFRDKFHNRVMFPIFDVQGNPVGFSGRLFDARHPKGSPMTPPKYLNTPETLIYNKGQILHGWHLARQAISEKDHVILVEGQFDLILSHQAGVRNTLATSGTALTDQQIRKIKNCTSTIYVAFDSDAAGEMATKRYVMLLLAQDISVHIISVEGGKDPADIIAEDPSRWHHAVAHTAPLIEFYLAKALTHHDPGNPEGKRKISEELLPLIATFPNPVLRGHYLSQLSSAIGVEERFLHEALERLPAGLPSPASETQRVPADIPRNRWTDIEEFLIAFLVKYPDAGRAFAQHLSEDLFASQHTRLLFPYAAGRIRAADAQDAFGNNVVPAELEAHLNQFLLKADRYVEMLPRLDPEKELRAFIHELSMRQLRERLRALGAELKSANVSLREKIIAEFARVSRELQKRERQNAVGVR